MADESDDTISISSLEGLSDEETTSKRYITEVSPDVLVDANLMEALSEQHNPEKQRLDRIYEIVRRYIIDNKLILVGGMAMHYALVSRNSKLYEMELIDYDFISEKFSDDAYKIADMIYSEFKKLERSVQVINGMHTSTMRVRFNIHVVADCTYMPAAILSKIPTFDYFGIRICEMFYQIIDQHLALSRPYEGAPLHNVTGKRWKNDIGRYALIMDKCSIVKELRQYMEQNKDTPAHESKMIEREIDFKNFKGHCLSGFIACAYWLNKADSSYGFKLDSGKLTYLTPEDSYVSLYSDDIKAFLSKCKDAKLKYFNAFVDKLPRKVLAEEKEKTYEIFDNLHYYTAAHEIEKTGVYVIGIQSVAVYMLIKAIFEGDLNALSAYDSISKLMLQSISDESDKFLYELTYYGKSNMAKSLQLNIRRQCAMMKRVPLKIQIPPHYVPGQGKIPLFDPATSDEYQFDGLECGPFEQIDVPEICKEFC